jgi:hypothetical protein
VKKTVVLPFYDDIRYRIHFRESWSASYDQKKQGPVPQPVFGPRIQDVRLEVTTALGGVLCADLLC